MHITITAEITSLLIQIISCLLSKYGKKTKNLTNQVKEIFKVAE